YASAPFFTGFIEGYLTMDAIAALAFGIIVVNAFKERGVTTQRNLVTSTLKSGVITGIALILVYASLGWIRVYMAAPDSFELGGELLSAATQIMFGNFGALLLRIIVTLACFTTSVGLVVATGQFFNKVAQIPFRWVILIFSGGCCCIAKQAIDTHIVFCA